MTLKYLFNPLWLLMVMMMLVVASCSSEELMPSPDEEQEYDLSSDIIGGLPIFYINIDSEDCLFDINTNCRIAFEGYQSISHVDMNVVEENGKQYLKPTILAPLEKSYEIYTGRVINLDDEDIWRNIVIIVHDNREASNMKTRSESAEDGAFRSVYSDYIGMGTHCFGEPFHKAGTIFNYEHFFDESGNLSRKFFVGTTTNPTTSMFEYEGTSLSETSKEYGFNLGLTGKLPMPGGKDVHSRSSLNFSVTDKTKNIESHEFYLNVYKVKTAEIKMQMFKFEHNDGDMPLASAGELFWMLDSTFVKAIFKEEKNFNPSKFWDNWGTEVITQASFGGSHTYIYGRQQNSYEHSVAVDATTSVAKKGGKNDQDLSTWVDLWKEKNSNISKYDMGFSYNSTEYQAASKMFEYETTVGGYVSFKDPKEWANGFKENCTWAPISYTTSMDMPNDDYNKLYSIESVMLLAIDAWENAFPAESFSEQDKALIANARAKVNKLISAKETYINEHVIDNPAPQRLVIADIQMRKFDGIKKKGNGEPFVEKDPTSRFSDKYLIYYPMMANNHAPCDNLYPFSASRSSYASAAHYQDQIFYYALAPADSCQGIVDIVFEEKVSECPDEFYIRRGNPAKIGYGMNNKSNYVYVKYFDPDIHQENQKITAFALVMKTNRPTSGDIYASTAGAERKPAFTQSEKGKWENFWDKDEESGPKLKWNKTVWFEGAGLIKPKDLWPAYSTKTLPISTMTDKNVVHPKKY